ncbi:MAG: hypothetical protein R3C49_13060 [Planctomycetaceae bacterium]
MSAHPNAVKSFDRDKHWLQKTAFGHVMSTSAVRESPPTDCEMRATDRETPPTDDETPATDQKPSPTEDETSATDDETPVLDRETRLSDLIPAVCGLEMAG